MREQNLDAASTGTVAVSLPVKNRNQYTESDTKSAITARQSDSTEGTASANKQTQPSASAATRDVILHAFDWPYALIAKNAHTISQIGYRTVLVSPPMKSLKDQQGTPWWQRYQPQDYRVIDNQLGDTADFFHMVQTLCQHHVQVYVDVVFNHMANESWCREDLQYPSNSDMQHYLEHWERYQELRLFGDLSQPLFEKDDFVEAFGIEDWKDKWQVQNGRISGGPEDPGLPTLRDSEHVVTQQQNYLKALKRMGVRGFRIDAAKHMTLAHLKKVWTDEIVEGVHIFGEIITDGGASREEYEIFLKPYLQYTELAAYDFPLFNTVFAALQADGDMASLVDPYCFGQALSNPRAITFAITHDVPNNDVFRSLVLDEAMEWLANCYILGRDGGVPLIYTDLDPSGLLNSQGEPRWTQSWQDPRMAAMIAFHNQVHGEPMARLMGDEDYLLFSRGEKGLVAMNKSDQPVHICIDWPIDMRDCLTDQGYPSVNGELTFTVAAKSYLMLIC